MHCTPPGVECNETPIIYIIMNLGDYIASGANCPDHMQLASTFITTAQSWLKGEPIGEN